jgi:hypothetical protein
MIVNVRTNDDLRDLLADRQSGNWIVSAASERRITKVRVFNWDVTQVLKGDFDPLRSFRDTSNKLILRLKKCRIENFNSSGTWSNLFGSAAVVYTEEVSIQIQGGERIAIVRGNYIGPNTESEIKDYFDRLKREIGLRGIGKIVFQGGGNIPIPDDFREWCKQNNIKIEILDEDELNRLYPEELDMVSEEDLSSDEGNQNTRG